MNVSEDNKETDIWRDTPLRYAGYCNEVGEAFAPLYPRLLLPTYVVSVLYVLGDTSSKSSIEYNEQKKKFGQVNYTNVAIKAGDVLMWQMLASVIIPGLTIKAVAKSATALCKTPLMKQRFGPGVLRFAPTALGLLTIPFIIKPIDILVDDIIDMTYRKYCSS